ncbi:major facilitator superfamily domain-containing protein [Aspergillus alliaceus]|uniref:major facilitator superfamily domain-containing protein n=1 Tax=Petromyces alliaceus TaxID=209559 RepID=UPI0012A75873|nr:major facilitator superfamily domain-containing protein [Aspergillus alliaceus]KAB8231646.1 major facilitator superfamily domain-containing protein [Aspergillus alliaceus]
MVELCLAVFLTGMDQMILATVAPTLTNEFHSIDDLGWWTAAYQLMLSVFQIPYGKLYSLFSIEIIYLSAISVFELGSLVRATAPNSIAMTFGRAIAGAGAAGIFTGGIRIRRFDFMGMWEDHRTIAGGCHTHHWFALLQVFAPGSKTLPRSVASYALAVQHKSALGSRVMLTPWMVGYVIFSLVARVLTSGVGYYNPPMILGTTLASVGAGLVSTLSTGTSNDSLVGFQFLYGVGVGLGFGQPSYIVQTVLSDEDIPNRVTLITLVQHLSSAIFVALGQGVFQNILASSLDQFNKQNTPYELDAYSTRPIPLPKDPAFILDLLKRGPME